MKQTYYYIGIILVIIIIMLMPSKTNAQSFNDSNIVKMNGTYTTSYGKVKSVYLDKKKRKLFYMRNDKKRYYFKKVNLINKI